MYTTHADQVTQVEPIRKQGPLPLRKRLRDGISGRDALIIASTWITAVVALTAISPAPTDDPQSALVVSLNLAFNLGFFGALAAAMMRVRATYLASMLAGGAMAMMATFCGLEGHTGLWIPAQALVGVGFLAYGATRLRA